MLNATARRQITSVVNEFNSVHGTTFEPEVIITFVDIESAGRVFWTVGGKKVPAIRPECHYFLRNLPDTKKRAGIERGLAHRSWTGVKVPRSYAGVYKHFAKMKRLDSAAAYKSISMGVGQVMGEHATSLGYSSAKAMYDVCLNEGLAGQVNVMLDFINSKPSLVTALETKDWHTAARIYNGPAYKRNRYAYKMAKRYESYSTGKRSVGRSVIVETYQLQLTSLGYNLDVDGSFGPKTRRALIQFQQDNGLEPDGKYGPVTRAALEDATTASHKKSVDGAATVGAGTGAAALVGVAAYVPPSTIDTVVTRLLDAPILVAAAVAAAAVGFVFLKWRNS